jgi:hypothetical protein
MRHATRRAGKAQREVVYVWVEVRPRNSGEMQVRHQPRAAYTAAACARALHPTQHVTPIRRPP